MAELGAGIHAFHQALELNLAAAREYDPPKSCPNCGSPKRQVKTKVSLAEGTVDKFATCRDCREIFG